MAERLRHRLIAQFPAVTAAAAFLFLSHEVSADPWRAGQPDVVKPQPSAQIQVVDYKESFRERYVAADRPRLVLFWNVAFDDQTDVSVSELETERNTSSKNYSSLEDATRGEAGVATLVDGDEIADAMTVRERKIVTHDTSKRTTDLSERNSVELETAFVAEMRAAGLIFVDRASAMRRAQANERVSGANPKQLEADSVMEGADYLLEILMIMDDRTALGWGFNVSLIDVDSAQLVSNFYTLAMPMVPPPPGRYVATSQGFMWTQSPPVVTVADVGKMLAFEVMENIGPVL